MLWYTVITCHCLQGYLYNHQLCNSHRLTRQGGPCSLQEQLPKCRRLSDRRMRWYYHVNRLIIMHQVAEYKFNLAIGEEPYGETVILRNRSSASETWWILIKYNICRSNTLSSAALFNLDTHPIIVTELGAHGFKCMTTTSATWGVSSWSATTRDPATLDNCGPASPTQINWPQWRRFVGWSSYGHSSLQYARHYLARRR